MAVNVQKAIYVCALISGLEKLARQTYEFYERFQNNYQAIYDQGIRLEESVQIVEVFIGDKKIACPGAIEREVPKIIDQYKGYERAMQNIAISFGENSLCRVNKADWHRAFELRDLGLLK